MLRNILPGLTIVTMTLTITGLIIAKALFNSPLSWVATLSPVWVPGLFVVALSLSLSIVGTAMKLLDPFEDNDK